MMIRPRLWKKQDRYVQQQQQQKEEEKKRLWILAQNRKLKRSWVENPALENIITKTKNEFNSRLDAAKKRIVNYKLD